MIQLEYKVGNAGWAECIIGNGKKKARITVSYLHDTLKELADSAIEIGEKERKSIVFMDEPGEHVLILNRNEEKLIDYELRWYKDWWSWNLTDEDDYQLVFKGQTTVPKYINQVRSVLIGIMEKLGPKKYKEKWIEHDFPLEEYEKLK